MGADEVGIYLWDEIRCDYRGFTPSAWMGGVYRTMIADALAVHARTMGGAVALGGTSEQGGLLVQDTAERELINLSWRTMAVADFEAEYASGRGRAR